MPDNIDKLIERATKLLEDVEKAEKARVKSGVSLFQVNDLTSRGANLIHSTVGVKSAYAENIRNALKQKTTIMCFHAVGGVLQGFYLDLLHGHLVNIRHEVEAVVVSEILSQAKKLANTKGIHPAAAVMLLAPGWKSSFATGARRRESACQRSNAL